MTETLLLRVDIRYEHDVVLVRQRARQLAMLLGFESQDQTRMATSVSEIARNAYEYAGGGRASFLASLSPMMYLVRIADDGPGIADLGAILDGRFVSTTGMGLGMVGARRLVDFFTVEPGPRAAPPSPWASCCRQAPRRSRRSGWQRSRRASALPRRRTRSRNCRHAIMNCCKPSTNSGSGRRRLSGSTVSWPKPTSGSWPSMPSWMTGRCS
jgi:anti-sigma regulatory factor (Ser/Thr protein kinase)